MLAEQKSGQSLRRSRSARGIAAAARCRSVRLLVALALALAAAFGSWFALGAPAQTPPAAVAADPVVLSIYPSSPNLWLCNGGPDVCTNNGEGKLVVSDGVWNLPPGVHLGSFDFTLYFDRNVVNVSATEGPFLGSTGRQTQCQQVQTESSLRMACMSTGNQPGAGGGGILAYITLTPNVTIRPTLNNGIDTYLAQDTGATLTDDLNNPIPVGQVSGSNILVRALEGDVNKDCRVNVIDEQAESVRYGTTLGLWPYDLWFDLEPATGDYDIDIKDLQFVFGRDLWTCHGQEPPPEPTPSSTATSMPTDTPTVTRTPTQTPTATLTATPTATSVPPTATRTATPTATSTATPTASRTSTATATATRTATATATSTATSTATPTASRTSTATATATRTATATATAVPPTATRTATPTALTATPSRTPCTPANTSTPKPTKTPAPTKTRTPSGNATATSVAVTATPTRVGFISPTERAPARSTVSPAEVTRSPTALPGSGSGNSGGSSGGTLAFVLAALLATAGWLAIAGAERRNGGLAREVLERLRSRARGSRGSRRS